jgi:hypothetical protein
MFWQHKRQCSVCIGCKQRFPLIALDTDPSKYRPLCLCARCAMDGELLVRLPCAWIDVDVTEVREARP